MYLGYRRLSSTRQHSSTSQLPHHITTVAKPPPTAQMSTQQLEPRLAYIRSSLQWNDNRPNNISVGQSPDIIPVDVEQIDPNALVRTYDQFMAQPLRKATNNNIYIRAAAYSGDDISVEANLYATYSTLIAWPDLFFPLKIGSTILQPPNIGDSNPKHVILGYPITYSPPALEGTGISLFAAIEGAETSIPEAGIQDWQDYIKLVAQSRSFALLNYKWVSANVSMWSNTISLQMRQIDTEPVRITMDIQATNMVKGSTLALECDKPNSNGGPIVIGKTSDFSTNPAVITSIPHDFSANLTLSYTAPDGTSAKNNTLIVLSIYVKTGPNTLALLGKHTIAFSTSI